MTRYRRNNICCRENASYNIKSVFTVSKVQIKFEVSVHSSVGVWHTKHWTIVISTPECSILKTINFYFFAHFLKRPLHGQNTTISTTIFHCRLCFLHPLLGWVSTDDLVDPIAAATDWVKGEVARALVDGAGNAGARIPETVDELFAGEGVGKDTHVQALRISVVQNFYLIK